LSDEDLFQKPPRGKHVLRICGLDVRVCVTGEREFPALKGKYGLACFDEATIYLHEDNPPALMRTTLVHEVLHFFLEASGLGALLGANLAKGTDADAFEELAIRLATPHVLGLLEDGDLFAVEPLVLRKVRAPVRAA